MSNSAWRSVVEVQAKMLGPRLYEAMSVAIPSAEARAKGLARVKYPHLRPLIVRCVLRENLEGELLPPGWHVDGNPALMGQLFLVHPELGLRLRVLKERRKMDRRAVPHAGRNPVRRRAWQAPLPELSVAGSQPVELLLLWDYAKSDQVGVVFTLRIVHTTEPGHYGQAIQCDLELEVEAGGSIFETLSFAGDDDVEDFFHVDIDQAENDE